MEKSRQLEEIKRRVSLYYGSSKTTRDYSNIMNRNVILADDGIATGATIIAAARWIRATRSPARFMIAIPVAPDNILNLLKREAIDHIEVLETPSVSEFRSVGQYYQNFEPVSDEKVVQVVQSKNQL